MQTISHGTREQDWEVNEQMRSVGFRDCCCLISSQLVTTTCAITTTSILSESKHVHLGDKQSNNNHN